MQSLRFLQASLIHHAMGRGETSTQYRQTVAELCRAIGLPDLAKHNGVPIRSKREATRIQTNLEQDLLHEYELDIQHLRGSKAALPSDEALLEELRLPDREQ